MATNASIIGALKVIMGADTADLEKGLKSSQSSIATFGKGADVAMAAVAAAAAAATLAFGFAVKGAIDSADQLSKASQKFGVPVEELSKLKLAADLSDVSMDTLGRSLGKLSKNMAAAASGADNDVSRAFQAIGVSATDANGKLRPTSDVLQDIAGKFKNYEDGAGKTALAIALFGKAGAEMIPLLNSGKDGLRDAADEAEKFGVVLDSKTAKSAEQFNDNLKRLGTVKDGIILKITAGLLPAMENLSNAFVTTAKSEGFITSVSQGVSIALQTMATGAAVVSAAFGYLWTNVSAVFTAIKQAASLNFAGAAETMKTGGVTMTQTVQGAMDQIKTIWGQGLQQTATVTAETAPKIAAPIVQAANTAKSALEQFLFTQKKQRIAQAAEVASADMYVGAKERMKAADLGFQAAAASGKPITDAQRQAISENAAAAELAAQKIYGMHLVQQNRTPAENYIRDLDNARLSMEALGRSTEEVGAAQQKIAERYGATWQQASESIAGSIQKIGSAFGKENKAMALVARAAGIVQGTISMFTGAAKALELPFPANIAAMASVLATGAGLVAQIKGTSVGGFATGGSFTVPGGIGGGDKVMAMFEPGERVDVWRPGEPGGDPRAAATGGVREIVVRGLKLRDLVTGRELLEVLNQALGDGARVRFA